MRHTFTNSERKSAGCAHMWLFKYGLRLRKDGRSTALMFGSIWHDVMSAWWKAKANGRNDLARIHACRSEATRQFEKLREDVKGFDLHDPVKVNTEDLDKILELLAGMVRGYERRYGQDDTLHMIADELVLGHPTISIKGNQGASIVMGRVDKVLVDNYGQHWIGEHKTSGSKLDDWRWTNGYDPQAPTYAWLLKHSHGIDAVGVCYDLAFKANPPKQSKFKLADKNTRLSMKLPANCTARAFLTAIRYHGFRVEDHAWYREKLDAMEGKRDPFFKRVFVRFEPGAVERVGLELHSESTRLRGYDNIVRRANVDWREDHSEREWEWQHNVIGILNDVGHRFPRNSNACVNRYGRVCGFKDLCRHQNIDALVGLSQIPHKHRELADDTVCTCGAFDPKFNGERFTCKAKNMNHTGSVFTDVCLVCGLERKPPLSSMI